MPRPSYGLSVSLLVLFGVLLLPWSYVQAVVINFDGLSDLEPVTNQFAGATFTNTITLTAGISLNEFEFPPLSDFNVASDDGEPISIAFSVPVLSFGGFFTYLVPLTIDAFDAGNNPVGQALSAFNSNLALSGDPGSSPNEFLGVAFLGGIASVVITGDPFGGSFTMDDVSFESQVAVPEPTSAFLLLTAGSLIGFWRKQSHP